MSYEINLIEGERGKLHVTSDDARTKNALMFGAGRKVYNMDHAFEATMPDSNTVRITSGVFYDNGMFIRIDRDRYVEVPVDNGLPGTYRNDLICIRYERNIQTQLESASIVVKKGEASETKAVDPAYSVGDVLDLEVHLDEFPLYRVALDGITPKLEPMFTVEDVMSNISLYEEIISHIQDFDNPHQITSVNHAVMADKLAKAVKINGVAFDGTEDVVLPKVESDAALSTTSTNAVQNKVITAALNACAKITTVTNGNFNNITTPGFYAMETPSANCPIDSRVPISYGLIVLKADEDRIEQIASRESSNMIYVRYLEGSTWSTWTKLLTTDKISQSTSITTAGTYALDAVENNASVSGTLANRTKTLEDTIGKIYNGEQTGVTGDGTWKILTLVSSIPAGTYLITRKVSDKNGHGAICGKSYNTGEFVSAEGTNTAIYTEIVTYPSATHINIYYLGNAAGSLNLEVKAVRLK